MNVRALLSLCITVVLTVVLFTMMPTASAQSESCDTNNDGLLDLFDPKTPGNCSVVAPQPTYDPATTDSNNDGLLDLFDPKPVDRPGASNPGSSNSGVPVVARLPQTGGYPAASSILPMAGTVLGLLSLAYSIRALSSKQIP